MLLAALLLPTIWIVDAANGPGTNFVDLPQAIAAASSGDTIVLRAGSYSPFVAVGKALAIRGDGPGLKLIARGNINSVPGPEAFLITGVTFGTTPTTGGLVVDGTGRTILIGCVVAGLTAEPGLVVQGSAMLHAQRTTFRGGGPSFSPSLAAGPGARVTASASLVATDCQFIGQSAPTGSTPSPRGGDGLVVLGGQVELAGSACRGGSAGEGQFGSTGVPGTGIYVQGGVVRVTVSGAVPAPIVGGGVGQGFVFGPSSGPAVTLFAGTATVHAGVVLEAGLAGSSITFGPVGLNAPATPTLRLTGTIDAPSGDTLGSAPVQVAFNGLVPNAAFFLLIGFAPDLSSAVVPQLQIDLQSASALYGVLDGAGQFAFGFVPAQLLPIYDIPILVQCGTFDPVQGAVAGNVDIRVYRP